MILKDLSSSIYLERRPPTIASKREIPVFTCGSYVTVGIMAPNQCRRSYPGPDSIFNLDTYNEDQEEGIANVRNSTTIRPARTGCPWPSGKNKRRRLSLRSVRDASLRPYPHIAETRIFKYVTVR